MNYPKPDTIRKLQSFLGLAGYFRKFIQNYAAIVKPLSDLLRSNVAFTFGEKQCAAFTEVKKILCSRPVLNIYNPEARTEVHTDASKHGYGAILLQQHDEDLKLHPVYFLRKKTSPIEEKYSAYELEVLAVIYALKKFRVYLLGVKFKLITDCAAFKCTMKKKDTSPKIARWAMLIAEFDFEIEHRPAERMRHVDALSRNPMVMILNEDNFLNRVRTAQGKDESLRALTQVLEHGEFEDYAIEGGILFKYVDGAKRLVVPKGMQQELVRKIHDNGHFAARKMENILCQDYYMPNMKKRISDCIAKCIPCILATKQARKEGFLHPIPKEATPLETYHIDHLGPMTPTKKGYRYIFTVVDAFTKFVWLYPLKTTTTAETLQKLKIQQTIFGNPRRIISDKGPAFTSASFENYCESERIEHVTTTTGVPRGNGQVERIHRIVISILTKLAVESEESWYKHISRVQRWINASSQRSIGTTPFQLMFGTKMRSPDDVALAEAVQQELEELFLNERNLLREEAAKNISKIQEENIRSYNKGRKPPTSYNVGDLVAIKRTQFGPCLKISPKYLGPYRVTKVKDNERFDVEKVGSHEGPKTTSTAVDNIKPYSHFDSDDDMSQDDDVGQESDH